MLIISLSGIIVILARGVARSRQTQFSASIKAVEYPAGTTETNEVLRPTQKSVHAIHSRGMLLKQWVASARSGVSRGVPRVERLKAVGERVGGMAQSSFQRVGSRFRRNKTQEFSEPDIDALFAPPAAPTLTSRVVDKASATAAALTGATPLHAMRQKHPAKKKVSPLQRAQAAINEKDYQHAEDILVDYIVHHTKDTKAYMLLGNVAMAKANWDESVEIFEQVVALRPEEPGAQAGLGIAAYNLGRYSKALQALQRAHEEDPENLTVLNDLLEIAKKMDNPALQRSIRTKLEARGVSAAASQVGLRQ